MQATVDRMAFHPVATGPKQQSQEPERYGQKFVRTGMSHEKPPQIMNF